MPDVQDALLEQVLIEVGKQTALAARTTGRPELATQPRDEATLKGFYDSGRLKLLVSAGIITPFSNEINPPTNWTEMVPFESWPALTAWVMSQWYKNIDQNLGLFWEGEFEKADYRFTPNIGPAHLPYRPLG